MADIGAVHHHKCLDFPRQRRFLGQTAHTPQIAFPLFARIGRQQQPVMQFGTVRTGLPGARNGQQGGQAGAVIGHARAGETPIRLHGDIVLVARRHDGVQVRRQRDVGGWPINGDHVARAVDGGFPAGRLELFDGTRWRAPLRETSAPAPGIARKWASLTQCFSRVNHWQALPHPAMVCQFAEIDRHRSALGSHSS